MTFLHFPKDKNVAKKDIGGKAYSLYLLEQHFHEGLNIPKWFVVRENTQALSASSEQKVIFEKEVLDTLHSFGENKLWAVRSSASQEDGAQNSFAGQLDTYLYVPTKDVLATIEKVWASIHSEHFVQYTQEKNITIDSSPAVLIQLMVNAECAGVGFAVNPITQEKEGVISSVYGLGNQLVSGETDADTWHIRNGKIQKNTIAHKPKKEVQNSEQFGTTLIDNAYPDSPSLTETQVLDVYQLTRKVSAFYRHPQDIEWAIEGGVLYLLQSRPITTVNSGSEILWDNSNIAESYGGVTTPLTFSFAKRAYENVYRELCLILKISPKKVARHDVEFRNMLGLVKGRVFYNMNSWYKTLALLPGFSINKNFMEQMMGVKEALSDELVQEIQKSVTQNKMLDMFHLASTSFGLMKSLSKLDSTVHNFYQRLNSVLVEKDLSQMNMSELMQYYNSLELALLKKWDAPMVNDLFAMIFYGVLKKLSKAWCNDQDESLQNALILTQGGIISAQPAQLMKQMALKIRQLGIMDESFTIWCDKVNSSSVKVDIQAYLDRFGDRCLDELKLESLTLVDNPTLLYQTLYELTLHSQNLETVESKKESTLEADTLKSLPFMKKHIFSWVLKMTRKTVRERENLRFERTRLFGRVRRIFLAIGSKMVEQKTLNEVRDIFYLEVGEIQSFIEGTSTLTNLASLVQLRKTEFDGYEKEVAPSDRFTTFGPVYMNNRYLNTSKEVVLSGNMQQGLGASPGIVQGKVRVVRDPKNVTLEKGVILVAERTDPGWIMLFPSASAILVEKGSLLSHAAIVSRELNLPSVVSVPGLMDWLKDGDIVEMNGTTGTITKIN
jgi:rifampicin phosphotransferase